MRLYPLDQSLLQRFSKHIKHNISRDTMIHRLYDSGTLHIDCCIKSTSLEEFPNFWSEHTKLSRQFQVDGNQLGIVAYNLIGSLSIFNRILTLKQLFHGQNVECLVLEFLDIFISRFKG